MSPSGREPRLRLRVDRSAQREDLPEQATGLAPGAWSAVAEDFVERGCGEDTLGPQGELGISG
ncbi:MAG TPA: hypothetical protein VI197_12150 [Polyangiaceae bacterium]